MSKDSTDIILDILDRLEKKVDDLSKAYISLAPTVESVKKHSDWLTDLQTKQDSHGKFIYSVKVAGIVISTLSGILFYSANTYLTKMITDTVSRIQNQPQAILNENRTTGPVEKQKDKK